MTDMASTRSVRSSNRRRTTWLGILGVTCCLAATACTDEGFTIGNAAIVVEVDQVSWSAFTPISSAAVITQADGEPMQPEFTVTARVEWKMPNGQPALQQELTVVEESATQYSSFADGALAEPSRVGDLRWLVEDSNGNLIGEDSQRFQVDCPDGAQEELASIQDAMLERFGDITTLDEIVDEGYAENTHGNINIRGIGVSFIGPHLLDVDEPSLIVFVESGNNADPTNATLDEPLQFVGWGYPAPNILPGRPTLGCVPYHEWFLHAAGWHTPADGGMVVDPGLGDPAAQAEALAEATEGGGLAFYHPQVWDLHFWADDSGMPRLSIWNDPGGVKIPNTGFDAADDTIFFYP